MPALWWLLLALPVVLFCAVKHEEARREWRRKKLREIRAQGRRGR